MKSSVSDQVSMSMLKVLAKIAQGEMNASEAAVAAMAVLEAVERIQSHGEPLRSVEAGHCEDSEHSGQSPGLLYTLTITEEGGAKEWCSDQVQTAEQVAWVYGIVLDAAAHLASSAGVSALK